MSEFYLQSYDCKNFNRFYNFFRMISCKLKNSACSPQICSENVSKDKIGVQYLYQE